MPMKKFRIVSLCLLLAVLTSASAFAAPMTSNTTTMPKSYSTGAHSANELVDGISPLTGLPWSGQYRPVVVQISNAHEARPHWNMAEADIVYEMIYWGPAHTRYTAVYNDNHPAVVGSVRSARTMHCTIREEWDAPFVFWGGQQDPGTNIYDFFRENNVYSKLLFDGVGKVTNGGNRTPLYRETGRPNPHDAAVNLQDLVNLYWPTNEDGTPYEPRVHAFRFSDVPTQGTETAQEIHIPYEEGEYYPSYTYNAATREYERWYNGEEQVDGSSGKRIVASNVIIQFADLTYYQNTRSRPEIWLIGGGIMDAFIDGKHVRGTWERATMSDRTVFMDASGEEITMLPGKTFIQIVPTSMAFTYIKDDGTEIKVEAGVEAPIAAYDPNQPDDELNLVEDGDI